MRFLIVGDLHGQKPKIHFRNFDAIIAPGDFCSDKGIREIYMKMYGEYIKDIKNYKNWWDIIGKNKAKKRIVNSLKTGRKNLEFLNSYNVPVFLVPGNWDWTKGSKEKWAFVNQDFWKNELLRGLKNIKNIDRKRINFKQFQFIGYGKCNGPELLKYRDYGGVSKSKIKANKIKYKKLLMKENKLFSQAKKNLPIIFLSHNVPFNTNLDKITRKGSPRKGYHYGSLIARKMIDKHQPLVCIGGHMHEHFNSCKIGKTTCIDTGFGPNVNILLEINNNNNNKIKKLEFYPKKYG